MTPRRYHPILRVLHWAIALLIITLFCVGLYMTGLEDNDPLRGTIYGLHKAFGALVLMLAAIRLTVRLATRIPANPPIACWELRLASTTHVLLYILIFAVPLAGIWMSNSWGYGVSFFGLADLPRLFPENKEIAPLAGNWHEWLAFTLIGLVALHVSGALKHRFIDRNDVIYRMTFGKLPEEKQPGDEG